MEFSTSQGLFKPFLLMSKSSFFLRVCLNGTNYENGMVDSEFAVNRSENLIKVDAFSRFGRPFLPKDKV